MSITKVLKQFTLVSLLLAATAMAQTPYDDGQKALREQRWTDAAEQFNEAIKVDKANADAAMYWRAHALYKAGRRSEAERQIGKLERKYPDSRWVKEARVLQIEHESSAPVVADAASDTGLDAELRMFALAQLMQRDPDRALPLVIDALENADSKSTRSDALFMLGMSDSEVAQQAVADIASDSSDPELQADAINILGVSGSQISLGLLKSLYTDSASKNVKKAVIHAYLSNDEAAPLLEILKTEKDPGLQRDIIHMLGAMDATSELDDLYPTLTDSETRIAAIEAFSMAGDTARLRRILETETDPELRKACIYGIAMDGGAESTEFLKSIYANASGTEEKTAILEALVMMDDAEELALNVVRTETDPELRQLAIEVLGVMGATAELGELYGSLGDNETRMTVLHAMAISGDTSALIEILETEKNAELRAEAIRAIGINDDDSAADYMVSLYPNGSRDEKIAVIESMMIMDNTKGLIALLKQETDPELKRNMLEMLSVMDSEEATEFLFELLENKG